MRHWLFLLWIAQTGPKSGHQETDHTEFWSIAHGTTMLWSLRPTAQWLSASNLVQIMSSMLDQPESGVQTTILQSVSWSGLQPQGPITAAAEALFMLCQASSGWYADRKTKTKPARATIHNLITYHSLELPFGRSVTTILLSDCLLITFRAEAV